MIRREAETTIKALARQFKAVAIVGPRQSGKTTLARILFPHKPYVNLENPDIRLFATEDPKGFLATYPAGALLDEVQRAPELFSYLQQILDESSVNGLFIITGSNNFLLQEGIAQSLAGRVGYLDLLPLSLAEIGKSIPDDLNTTIFKGSYPVIYAQKTDASRWYSNYIRTYIERDVRLIKNISNLLVFERFLRLCAGRIGQLLNMNSLAVEVGVDVKTIAAWIGVLETSFVAFRLEPHYKNFNKRIVKMPKLYFYDTGLACALLRIENEQQLSLHPFRGSLFENLVIVDFLKKRANEGKVSNLYFWRDNTGNEIDLMLDKGNTLVPIEIKSGETITGDFYKGIRFWNKISGAKGGFVIYAGSVPQNRSSGITIVPYTDTSKIMNSDV